MLETRFSILSTSIDDVGAQPFTVYFNADEKKGVTKAEIYPEPKGRMNPRRASFMVGSHR